MVAVWVFVFYAVIENIHAFSVMLVPLNHVHVLDVSVRIKYNKYVENRLSFHLFGV